MKGSRETLTNYLTSQFERNMRNKKELKDVIDYMVNDCNFPVLEVVDTVHLRRHMEDCSDRIETEILSMFDMNIVTTEEYNEDLEEEYIFNMGEFRIGIIFS